MTSRHSRLTSIALVLAGLSLQPVVGGVSAGAPAPTPGASQDSPAPRARSVLFYLMDTCRGDRTGFDGYERETTPFLEWLAERSVVFEACHSQAPWTKPSMASMLSSQYPGTTGVYRMEHRLPFEVLTWPEVLQANGLFTAGFSANIVMGDLLSNFAQGFDHFVESTLINGGDPIHFASGSARKLNQHVFPWLDRTDHWPMLLYLHSVDPHEEYEPAPSFLERFADPERHPRFREEWKKLLGSRPPIPGLYVTQDNFDRTDIDSTSFIEHASNLYDADILANDDQLRRLWEKLQEDGWGEDFILVFTSDHGEEFFEHGGTSHGYSLYDEMTRVPLMIYAPGLLPAGKRIETPVRCLDLYPTLCELLDLEIPEGLQGRSLVPLMRDGEVPDDLDVFAEHHEDPLLRRIGHGSGVLVSLRSGRWKFILNEKGSQLLERPRHELYDVEEDPGERRNVADAHPGVVEQLEAEVVRFIAEYRRDPSGKPADRLDPEVLDQLRALGYIGSEEAAPDLWAAMESGDPARVGRCLEAGADANQLDELLGVSPLAMAAMTGNLELSKVLLEGGARIDVRGRDGSTPLLGAAFLGRFELLEYLLREGADPGIQNANGDTVLGVTQAPWDITEFLAGLLGIPVERGEVEAGRKACAELLASIGQDPDDPTARLFAAIRAGDREAVERSIAEDAGLASMDPEQGWTPLSTAVFLGREPIARLLLEKGAEVQALNRDRSSTLHGAALLGLLPSVELLLEHGAKVDARDGNGSTPLHAAAFLGRVEVVECLLGGGADRGLENLAGQTALDVTATAWELTELVLQLLELELERDEVEKNRAEVAKLLAQ